MFHSHQQAPINIIITPATPSIPTVSAFASPHYSSPEKRNPSSSSSSLVGRVLKYESGYSQKDEDEDPSYPSNGTWSDSPSPIDTSSAPWVLPSRTKLNLLAFFIALALTALGVVSIMSPRIINGFHLNPDGHGLAHEEGLSGIPHHGLVRRGWGAEPEDMDRDGMKWGHGMNKIGQPSDIPTTRLVEIKTDAAPSQATPSSRIGKIEMLGPKEVQRLLLKQSRERMDRRKQTMRH